MSDFKWASLIITDPLTADIYKSLLESNDIPVFLKSDAAHTVHPFTVGVLGDVEVFVPEESLGDAVTLIETTEIEISEEEFGDELFGEDAVDDV